MFLTYEKMGLGSFRNRIIIAVVLILILWQSSKIWFPIIEDKTDDYKVNHVGVPPQELSLNIPSVQKVHVTVFYEALCPDSKSFFVTQLLPTFKRIPENIEIESIPYGNAKTTKWPSGYSFECQHGPTECKANIYHACVINVVKDPKRQLEFLTCMIKNKYNPEITMEVCAINLNVDFQPILACYNGKGEALLAAYGEVTEKNRKSIHFIPTIALDQNYDNQPAILKNLLKEVCLLLKEPPPGCTD